MINNHPESKVEKKKVNPINTRHRYSKEINIIDIKILVEYEAEKQVNELTRRISPYIQYCEEELFELGRS